MEAFIGIDIGTSAIKGVAVAVNGDLLGSARRKVEFVHPESGFIEFEPRTHVDSVLSVLAELSAHAGPGSRVAGISVAGASGSVLLLDRDGEPLSNCISWMDRRAAGMIDGLLPGFDVSAVHQIVGWPWREAFPLVALAWMRKMRPETYRRTRRVCLNTDYLLHRLTGGWKLDRSSATTFFLQHQLSGEWHRPFLEMLEIPPEALSSLEPSGSIAGSLTRECAETVGLPPGTPVVHGCFDHPSAARAVGVLRPGELLLSCGTSWVGFSPITDRRSGVDLGLLVDPFLSPTGPWGAMTSISRMGVRIDELLAKHLGGPEGEVGLLARFNALAERCEPGAGGLLVDTVPGSAEAPDGIPPAADSSHVARAIMEGAAFALRRKLEQGFAAGVPTHRIVMAGGPAESPVWPGIIADVSGLEIELMSGQNTTAVGAAILAGVGTGRYSNEEDALRSPALSRRTVYPRPAEVPGYSSRYARFRERFG